MESINLSFWYFVLHNIKFSLELHPVYISALQKKKKNQTRTEKNSLVFIDLSVTDFFSIFNVMRYLTCYYQSDTYVLHNVHIMYYCWFKSSNCVLDKKMKR
jgi:hypothetical protein